MAGCEWRDAGASTPKTVRGVGVDPASDKLLKQPLHLARAVMPTPKVGGGAGIWGGREGTHRTVCSIRVHVQVLDGGWTCGGVVLEEPQLLTDGQRRQGEERGRLAGGE